MSDLINYLEDSIQEVNKEILSLINGDKKLLRSYQLLTSIPGVGQVVASNTIAYTENFSKVTDPRKYCSFIGLMSYEQSSGAVLLSSTALTQQRCNSLCIQTESCLLRQSQTRESHIIIDNKSQAYTGFGFEN